MPLLAKSPLVGRSSALAGILFMLASVGIFGLTNAFSKAMVATYPPAQLFFVRGFGALAVLLPFLARDNFAAVRRVQRPALQALRVAFSVADGMLYFTALKYIPLADATTCYLAAPIFVTALSAIVLREPVGWRRWSAVMVGFAGVIIALRPSGAMLGGPALIALAGSLCMSGMMIVTRFLRGTPDAFLATAQVAGSFVFGGFLSTFQFVSPPLLIIVLLVLSGVVNVGGVMCLNRALLVAPASVVAPFQYTMIVWAIVLGFLVFGDVPSPNTVIGAAIVTAAGLYIFLRERTVMYREPQPNPPTVV
jgi:drug/metabolite transporter (DMT)-like permease